MVVDVLVLIGADADVDLLAHSVKELLKRKIIIIKKQIQKSVKEKNLFKLFLRNKSFKIQSCDCISIKLIICIAFITQHLIN